MGGKEGGEGHSEVAVDIKKKVEGGKLTDFQMTSFINWQPVAKQSAAAVSSRPLDLSNPVSLQGMFYKPGGHLLIFFSP